MDVRRLSDLLSHDDLVRLQQGLSAGIDELEGEIGRLQMRIGELKREAEVVAHALAAPAAAEATPMLFPEADRASSNGDDPGPMTRTRPSADTATLSDCVRIAIHSRPLDHVWRSAILWDASKEIADARGVASEKDAFYSTIYHFAKRGELIKVAKGAYAPGPRLKEVAA